MTFRLVHLSDTHFGGENAAALEAVRAFILADPPDCVVMSGDLTAVGKKEQFQAGFAWLRTLRTPVVVTPGNHDTPYFSLLPRLFYPFRSFYKAAVGTHAAPLRGPGFAICPINTARGVQLRRNWAMGAVSSRQVRRARHVLQAGPTDEVKIIVTHHPLSWPPDAYMPGLTRGGPKAEAELVEAGADLLLSGHLHTAHLRTVAYPNRTALAVSAGTLSTRLRGTPPSFMLIEGGAGKLLSVQTMAVQENGRVAAGPPML